MSADIFRSYTHIEKMSRPEVACIIENSNVYVQPKLDGANASIYSDAEGFIHYGSRTREIFPSKKRDNGGFAVYMKRMLDNPDDSSYKSLQQWVMSYPQYIVYGEWLGVPESGRKMLGVIKSYLQSGFFLFDVYDKDAQTYLPYYQYARMLEGVYDQDHIVPQIGFYQAGTATLADIVEKARECHYNLPGDVLSEGIVIKGYPSYRDAYGNIVIGKVVFDEYKLKKEKGSKIPDEMERNFVDAACTTALLSKTRQKILVALHEDTWENDNKHIGMLFQRTLDDLMIEEFWNHFKRYKGNIDLGLIRVLVRAKIIEFLKI